MIRTVFLCALLLFSVAVKSEALHIAIVTTPELEMPVRGLSFAGIQTKIERPVLRAARLALFESETIFSLFGIEPSLSIVQLNSESDFLPQLSEIRTNSLVIVDTPEDAFVEIAQILEKLNLATVNVRHPNPELRESLCLKTLFHTIPSERMYFDALVQFLIYSGWRKVLLVHGPSEIDHSRADILATSLKKFGADISDIREFTLSHYPDDRDSNRPEFITGGASYDVVAVIDTDRDYGRYFQYRTRRARPIVGDVGLTPRGWHRTLERYGAPQLNERYRTFDGNNQLPASEAMSDTEFATWAAIKFIMNSFNTTSIDHSPLDVLKILKDPNAQVDLYKGVRGSIRQWNQQLRQPILLATNDAVIAVAPMPKFLHPSHYVDTLGLDRPESKCQLD